MVNATQIVVSNLHGVVCLEVREVSARDRDEGAAIEGSLCRREASYADFGLKLDVFRLKISVDF